MSCADHRDHNLAILPGSLLMGAYVPSFPGISIPALRVAGGLVIAFAGWNLLQKPSDDVIGCERVSFAAT
ncbi:MarC family protein [Paraburkholderia lycopersici]|uniref:UPF0056 membrane protein n=1 Tax=Paraburkholderia lycopersici TaxID=416944 RepID=A0A1G6RCM0_9BURK|nr:MarC family protein [Paraburkholderia lycopersici]SDD02143.1 multiple antibiotic resistance protein [Paraburkholderia lycopersici]